MKPTEKGRDKIISNMMKISTIIIGLIFLACSSQADIEVSHLRCEFRENPFGIDVIHPFLSWEISGVPRGISQKSYHILVASSMEKLNNDEGDLWDSRKVKSDRSANVTYSGTPLESRITCYWKVKVTTNRGGSDWSQPAQWTMAFMDRKDWQAQWIGLDKSFPNDVLKEKTRLAARYLRKEFKNEKKVTKGTLYISGLGLYEAFINGKKIGDQVLSPTPTDYSKSVKYNTFDITGLLASGNNAIGVTLGNGRFFNMRTIEDNSYPPLPPTENYGFPKMILQLEIDYEDGSRRTLISDGSWKITADGPILANNEYDGEEYDARKEMPGWNNPGFNDSHWMPVELVEAPKGILQAQLNGNIKIMDSLSPTTVTEVKPGMYILDMGQNMVGWLSMKVKGKAGDKVKLRFAEVVNEDGTLYMANIRNAFVTDIYTLKGEGEEFWEPSFVYHGFRYVEITGYPGIPTIDNFEGKVIYDEMETTGSFESSDAIINQIYKNAYWGIRGNYRGMPTDCPQRDERMAWLGDRATGSLGESFIFNNHNLYAKWLDDIEESQLENGSIPDIAPAYWKNYNDNMTWPAAYLIIADMIYKQYGDDRPIIKHYESMKKWMKFMGDNFMVDHIMPRDLYGDWCMPPESPEMIHSGDPARKTDGTLLGTSFYYHMLCLLEKFALLQEKKDESKQFSDQAALIKEAYNNRFFNKETAQYSNNTVTANLISLCFNLVPEGYEKKVFENIVHKTQHDFNGHVSTGLVGIQWLMRGLSTYGRSDLAFQIATNRDYPSWGYMIENGATTIWELWNGNTADPAMNSQNHVMLLGDLIVWFYEYLGAIQNAPGNSGFKKIEMKPHVVDRLSHVTASYHSLHGMIKSAWKKSGDSFEWNITVPANSKAIVYIPAKDKKQITESEKNVSNAQEVKFLRSETNWVIFEVGSGNYEFKVKE
ncbi:MAG: family 78 glycoside hydrolase catalytic domain [Proteiniphilum sp.]|nr:family 78 glycoside hydrolase catalytic domain [Proteiniphilum sp.]MEA4917774.1 family 78 glycoside hydrolase catalytic domain [Proteiniphilum sp.]